MIKVSAFLVKLPTMTPAQFHAHWRHPHGTLTKKLTAVQRYVQNHSVESHPAIEGFNDSDYLGIPSIWVPTLASLAQMFVDPNYPPLYEDALLLYDQSKVHWFIGQETVLRSADDETDAAAAPAKAMFLLRGRQGVENEQLVAAVAAAAKIGADSFITVRRVSRALPDAAYYANQPAPAFDAIIEATFADVASFQSAWSAGTVRSDFIARLKPVVDFNLSRGFLAREERVIWPR